MQIEPNMYVRTKDGVITKIEQIIDDEIHFNIEPIFSDGEQLGYNWFYIKDVVKASYNIIDLIEVGDYVNGYKLLYQDSHYSYFDTDTCDWIYINKDEQIKSIVTKEQFESMQYEVK